MWQLAPRVLFAVLGTGFLVSFCDPARGSTGAIGIYADPQGISSCSDVPIGAGVQLFVVATLDGPSSTGIVGAEFRIEIEDPAGWFIAFSAPTGTTSVGQPLDFYPNDENDASGIVLAYGTCQPGENGRVQLGVVSVFNQAGSPTRLIVKRHSRPPNQGYSCPLLILCDAPHYSKVCIAPTQEDSACALSKVDAAAAVEDRPYFVAGLNGLAPPSPEESRDAAPMSEDMLTRFPVLVSSNGNDQAGDAPSKARSRRDAAADTVWIPSLTWDFEGTGSAGWTTVNNLIDNQQNYWAISPIDPQQPPTGGSKHAILRYNNSTGCWITQEPGYGNRWDYSIRVNYRGAGPTLEFDYSLSCALGDVMTIEADSSSASNERVDYTNPSSRWPWQLRYVILTESGTKLNQHAAVILPTFENYTATHAVYIRFSSNATGSDEDGLFNSAIDAALIVDNIVVTGMGAASLNYSVNFDGDVIDLSNVALINSGRSTPYGGSPWTRLYSHITDNDKCTENSTTAWLSSDPIRFAMQPDMAFGPGMAIIRLGLDDALMSPWIPTAFLSGGRPLLSYTEFPGNRFDLGRIARGISVRGRFGAGNCTTRWSDEFSSLRNGPWETLDDFRWVTRVADIGSFVDPEWDAVQVRLRVTDLDALLGGFPPLQSNNPGPGPFIDRIRLGRVPPGPFIDAGPDMRFQAQDAFPTEPDPTQVGAGERYRPATQNFVFGTCAFSMAADIASGSDGTSPVPGDSIVVRVGCYAGQVTRVSFVYRIVSGPHRGKRVLPDAIEYPGGLCEYVLATQPFSGSRVFAMDFDDDYFRGGDNLEYFWLVKGNTGGPSTQVSYPAGISQEISTLTALQAEELTDGLLEVNFLPRIRWSPSYRARVQQHVTGKVEPLAAEIAESFVVMNILYVNKANFDRRALRFLDTCEEDVTIDSTWCVANRRKRTALMFALDHLVTPVIGNDGSAGYDVYDVQGFGNTNNDLGSRLTPIAATHMYNLIIHDSGTNRGATLPDGSDKFSKKVNQVAWYKAYLDNGWAGAYGRGNLWVVGDNWATETNGGDPAFLQQTMGIGSVTDTEPFGVDASGLVVRRVAGHYFEPHCPGGGQPWYDFSGNEFALASVCPTGSPDGFEAGSSTSGTITHRYFSAAPNTVAQRGAIVINRSSHYLARWNTIGMGFAWSAVFDVGMPAYGSGEQAKRLLWWLLEATACCGCSFAYDTEPGVDAALPLALPRETRFASVSPNPFNATVTIRLEVASSAHLRLAIYDVGGRLVRTLIDAHTEPNVHRAVWDGRDRTGQPVASGVYYAQLKAGAVHARRKLVLVR